jgi:chromosomal replication initiator protein
MMPGDMAVADSSARESEILQELERRIGSRTFNLWIRGNASIEIAADQVTVNVHNKFLLSWLQQRYRPAILQAVALVVGPSAAVQFRELPTADPAVRRTPTDSQPATPIELPARPADRPHYRAYRGRAQGRGTDERGGDARSTAPRGNGYAGRQSRLWPSALADIPISTIAAACVQQEKPRTAELPREERPEHAARPADRSQQTDASASGNSSGTPPAPPKTPHGSGPSGSSPSGPHRPAGRRFADLTDFVTGQANQLAFAAALQVCEQPGGYNPLVLHGGVGIGKTHLLEGMYRRMRVLHPSFRVMFLSAESFANYFTQALRDRTLASFRQRFRGVDVLMIDDVDFLDGKRVIQEEFLHTIKQLESHGRQIALTADRHPRLLTRLSEELVTRFMSGIVCRLEVPDEMMRRTIAARKAARLTAKITDEAIEFVVQRFALSVRELEGALNFLETYGLMTGKTISLATARTVLADLDRDCARIVRVAEVEQAVCRLFSIAPGELRSSRRNRTVSQPRMLAMYLARKMTQAAYTEIGEHFGGRNHSTVMSAEKRVRSLLEADATVKAGTQEWKLGDLLASLEQQLQTG